VSADEKEQKKLECRPHTYKQRRRAFVTVTMSDEHQKNLMKHIILTGEKDRTKDWAREQLLECGWRQHILSLCTEIVKNRGLDTITMDDMIEEVLPRARAAIPAEIKTAILLKLHSALCTQQPPIDQDSKQ
jgi:enhancer of yellow 2 transcription factor